MSVDMDDLRKLAEAASGEVWPGTDALPALAVALDPPTVLALIDRLEAAERSVENLRLVSNANGDWTVKYVNAVRRAEVAESKINRALPLVEQAREIQSGRFDGAVAWDPHRALTAALGHVHAVLSEGSPE